MAGSYGYSHEKARKALLADDPLCVHCEAEGAAVVEPATVADHQPPLSLHEHVDGTGCCEYVPSCLKHSLSQGGSLSKMLAKGGSYQEVTFDEPEPSPGPSDSLWDRPWLTDLLVLPDDATWPRFMSAPHPDAVGSYGAEFIAWAAEAHGTELRWFQRLIATRVLEHDADGKFVHVEWFASVARQLGKSVLFSLLLTWATINVRRFWNANDVMLCSRTLMAAEAVVGEALRWADRQPDEEWVARKVNGQRGLIYRNQFELKVRSVDAAYGSTCGMVALDECWDIQSSAVAEGIEPTVLGAEGMIGYTTTAHRKATSLSLNLRRRAFEHLDDPGNDEALLIVEWSADRRLDISDEQAWRQASPHWNKFRRVMVGKRLKAAQSGEILDPSEPEPLTGFISQYLNQFPVKQTRRGPGEPLFETGAWASALVTSLTPAFQRIVAVEDNFGRGLSVAEAGLTRSETMAVRGWEHDDRDAGWAQALALDADVYLVSAGLCYDPAVRNLPNRQLRGAKELRSALSLVRTLVNGRKVTHDGSIELADQMLACRVRHGSAGLQIASKSRHDLVNAAAWAIQELHAEIGTSPAVH